MKAGHGDRVPYTPHPFPPPIPYSTLPNTYNNHNHIDLVVSTYQQNLLSNHHVPHSFPPPSYLPTTHHLPIIQRPSKTKVNARPQNSNTCTQQDKYPQAYLRFRANKRSHAQKPRIHFFDSRTVVGVWAHEHENPPRTRNQTKRNGSGTKAENSDVVVGMALLIGRYDLQSRENVCIPILTSYICRYLHSFLPMSSPHKCFPYITVHFPGLLTHSLALHETNPPSHVYLAHEIPFGGEAGGREGQGQINLAWNHESVGSQTTPQVAQR